MAPFIFTVRVALKTLLVMMVGTFLLIPPAEIRAQSHDGQTYTVVARSVPLDQALERVANVTGVNLIYDSKLVENHNIYCVQRDAPPSELLRCVLADTGLDFYQTSSGTYVLTRSVREAPQYGRLAGAIVDEDSGEPLPRASVFLAEANVGTATNEAGYFSFSRLKPGPHRIVVSYVGYEAKSDSVWIVPGESTRESFGLKSRSISAEPIIVRGLEHRAHSQTLGKSELSENELTVGLNNSGTIDVARSTAGMRGITLQEPSADLHLQGGAAGELQMHLDGIPIRSPVTVGQLLGAFSPLAIERMTVHKAGFGAAHGSHLSGSLEADHAINRTEQMYATAQLDPLSVNGRAQAYWQTGGGVETRAMLAARTSLWPMMQDPTLTNLLQDWHIADPLLTPPLQEADASSEMMNHRGDVAFSDLHAATRIRLSPFHTLHASAYRGHSEVESEAFTQPPGTTGEDTVPLLTRDSYHWDILGGQLRYEGLLGNRMLGMLRLYATTQSLGHGYQMGDPDPYRYDETYFGRQGPYDGNRINEMALEAGLDVNLMKRHHLRGAMKLSQTASRALINNDFFRKIDYSHTQWKLSGHVQDDISLGSNSEIELGTRLTFIPDRGTVYAEPRAGFRYDGTYQPIGDYALRVAGGVYRQFVNQFDISSTGPTAILPFIRFWLPVDRSLAPSRAYHVAADVLIDIHGPWQLSLESYYKWQPHLLAVDYPALLNREVHDEHVVDHSTFISSTEGRVFGGDIQLDYSTPDVNSTVIYSLTNSKQRFPGRFDDQLQPTPWEQPHRLSIENDVTLTSTLAAHVNWRGIWGRTWAFRRAYYDYLGSQPDMQSIAVDLSRPAQNTLPPLYQVDLGLSFEQRWNDIRIQLRAEMLNVLDRQNTFDLSLQNDGGFGQLARYLPGRRPAFSLRASY